MTMAHLLGPLSHSLCFHPSVVILWSILSLSDQPSVLRVYTRFMDARTSATLEWWHIRVAEVLTAVWSCIDMLV